MNLAVAALLLRFTWGNDVWADPPPADDNGFTNDLGLEVRYPVAGDVVHCSLLHRMITERWGQRRWDQVELTAGWERTFSGRGFTLAAGPRLGLGLGGNFGGRTLQSGWHRYTGTGPTVDQGLQDTYDGDRRAALLAGARASAARPLAHDVTPFVTVDAQVALGSTGVTRIEAAAGVRAEPPVGRAHLLLAAELALARYAADDPNLLLAGAYGTGSTELAVRVSMGATIRDVQFGWQFRSNEGGSGEPIGQLWFAINR